MNCLIFFSERWRGIGCERINESMESVVTECMAALHEIEPNGPLAKRLQKLIRLAKVAAAKEGCFCTEVEKRFSELDVFSGAMCSGMW